MALTKPFSFGPLMQPTLGERAARAVNSASRHFPAANLARVVLLKRVVRRGVGFLSMAAWLEVIEITGSCASWYAGMGCGSVPPEEKRLGEPTRREVLCHVGLQGEM